jgi:hypothetical protein
MALTVTPVKPSVFFIEVPFPLFVAIDASLYAFQEKHGMCQVLADIEAVGCFKGYM